MAKKIFPVIRFVQELKEFNKELKLNGITARLHNTRSKGIVNQVITYNKGISQEEKDHNRKFAIELSKKYNPNEEG